MKELPPGSLWVPSDGPIERTILALHGQGGRAADFEGLDKELALPGTQYLYLQAPIPYYTGYTWYSSPKQLSAGTRRLEQGIAALGVPFSSLFLIGFSQGGALAMQFAVEQKSVAKGVVAISSRVEDLPRLLSLSQPVQKEKGHWLFTHGTHDDMLSCATTKKQVQQLRSAGFQADYQEFDKGHTFDFVEEFPFIRRWIQKFS